MSNSPVAPLMKKQMIESQSPNGKCYLRLLCLVPSFNKTPPQLLEEAIVDMTIKLGQNPKGLDVLHELWNSEKIMASNLDTNNQDINDGPIPIWFIESIMSAPFRFGFEDRGGVIHLTYYLKDTCLSQDSDTEIETELGFASRHILQMMCNQGRHIGATEALDDFFNEFIESSDARITDDDFAKYSPPVEIADHSPKMKIEDHNTGLYDKDPIKRENQSRVEDVFNKMERKSRVPPMQNLDHNRELLERVIRMEERMNSVLSIREKDSVYPSDSSSNIGRYNKRFMETGSILPDKHMYNYTKGGTMLAIREEDIPLDITKDVAVGFVRTQDMRKKEIAQLQKVAPINGLANPFKSPRLNLLSHFHTAIYNVMPKVEESSYIEMMRYLVKYKPKCSSEELAYQIVMRTFDMESFIVHSNPFKLPFIEVGMQITDSTLVKCFKLLHDEYKSLWFTELKHLHVPEFHNEFECYSSNEFTQRKNRPKTHSEYVELKRNDKSSARGAYIRSKHGTSILSLVK